MGLSLCRPSARRSEERSSSSGVCVAHWDADTHFRASNTGPAYVFDQLCKVQRDTQLAYVTMPKARAQLLVHASERAQYWEDDRDRRGRLTGQVRVYAFTT